VINAFKHAFVGDRAGHRWGNRPPSG
jgi:hypothetical protein